MTEAPSPDLRASWRACEEHRPFGRCFKGVLRQEGYPRVAVWTCGHHHLKEGSGRPKTGAMFCAGMELSNRGLSERLARL